MFLCSTGKKKGRGEWVSREMKGDGDIPLQTQSSLLHTVLEGAYFYQHNKIISAENRVCV